MEGERTQEITVQDVEELIIQGLLTNSEYRKRVIKVFKPDYFQEIETAHIFRVIKEYEERYNQLAPLTFIIQRYQVETEQGCEDFGDYLKGILQREQDGLIIRENLEYLYDHTESYLKERALKQTILDGVEIVNRGEDTSEIPELIHKSLNVTIRDEDISFGMPWYEFADIEHPQPEYYLYPWLLKNSITLCSANPGIGKTLFALSLAKSFTQLEPFGNWQAPSMPVKTLYLDGELPPWMIYDMCHSLNIDTQQQSTNFLIVNRVYEKEQGSTLSFQITDPSFRSFLAQYCQQKNIQVLILDNLQSLTQDIDENSKKDWDPINQWLINLRGQGTSILMLHHLTKTGAQRGTSAREGNLDIELILKPAPERDVSEAHFITHFRKARLPSNPIDSKLLQQEMRLIRGEDGISKWEIGRSRVEKDEIRRMLMNPNVSRTFIRNQLHIGMSAIDNELNKLIEEGLMEKLSATKRELTPQGRIEYEKLLEEQGNE